MGFWVLGGVRGGTDGKLGLVSKGEDGTDESMRMEGREGGVDGWEHGRVCAGGGVRWCV